MVLLLGAGITAYGQDLAANEVPSVVVNAFQQKFANPADVEWEKEQELFKAEFEQEKVELEVWLDANGNFVRQSREMEENQLPAAVAQAIRRDYNGYQIDEVEQLEAGGVVTYEIELEKRSAEDVTVVYDQTGTKVQ